MRINFSSSIIAFLLLALNAKTMYTHYLTDDPAQQLMTINAQHHQRPCSRRRRPPLSTCHTQLIVLGGSQLTAFNRQDKTINSNFNNDSHSHSLSECRIHSPTKCN